MAGITPDDVRDFTFAYAVRLCGTQNPDFFEGTVIARQAAEVLGHTRRAPRRSSLYRRCSSLAALIPSPASGASGEGVGAPAALRRRLGRKLVRGAPAGGRCRCHPRRCAATSMR